MSRAIAALVLCVALLAAAPAAAAQGPAKRATATGTGGAVATVDAYATNAARDVLRRGGNAIDAAVTAAAVLSVTEPYSCGIGGGGFMVVRTASGAVRTIDHREEAPAAMTPQSFLGEDGKPIPFDQAVVSGLGVGVPGTVAGWDAALRRYGTITLRQALAPAERLARRGFVVDDTFFEQTEANAGKLGDFHASARIYLDPDGTPRDVGKRLRNRDLARTFRLLQRRGARAFYEGGLANALARTVQRPPLREGSARVVRPGTMTSEDLANYEAVLRRPTAIQFDGLDVYGMGPPSSGGSTVGEALNIIEALGPASRSRERTLHRMIEAAKLAYADRNAWIGDRRFVDVPLAGLLSQAYANERAQLIGETALPAPQAAAVPPGARTDGARAAGASVERAKSTTHLSVADADGRMVSYTFTIEQTGGSGITVPGYGFLLNNELTDFNLDGEGANRPQGGKRPRSSMAPTIVERDGRPVMALGSPGGATIITTVLQVLLERFDLGRSLPEAIAAPRLSPRNTPVVQAEPAFLASPEAAALAARGHRLGSVRELGAVAAVEVTPAGRLRAAAEPERRGGGAAAAVDRGDIRGR